MRILVLATGPTDGSKISLLDYVLKGTEQLHGKIRRYTSLEEHAFYPGKIALHVILLKEQQNTMQKIYWFMW